MSTLLDSRAVKQRGVFHRGPVVHLMVLSHYVQKIAMDKLLASRRYENLNLAFEGYITLLAERDYSPGELAARLGISKQACSKTIGELESLGLLERRKNPADSRSSLLSLTDKGRQLLLDGVQVTNEMYQQFAAAVGEEVLHRTVQILQKLSRELGIEDTHFSALEPVANTPGNRPASLTLLLPGLINHFRETLSASLSEKGFTGLKPSFGELLGLLDREARRIQQIAAIIGVSKQAVAAVASDLENAGYITKEPDPGDKRQVILQLTPPGKQLVIESVDSVRHLEASFAAILGEDDYRLVDTTLAAIYAQIAQHYDRATVVPARIQQISDELLAELGTSGVRALIHHLMSITRS